jgi:hypothetical protein
MAGAHRTRFHAWALFIYNLLAAPYLGYLRVEGGFVSYLLWPACVLHVLPAEVHGHKSTSCPEKTSEGAPTPKAYPSLERIDALCS